MTASSANDMARVADLLKSFRFAMLTTVSSDGKLLARPMTVQESEFDGDLWFFAEKDSDQVAQVTRDHTAGVSLSSNNSWLSLAGTVAVVEDPAKVHELWSPSVEAWFPKGESDPNVTLLKFTADSAEYWDSPGGTVSTLLSLVKSKLTGERMPGENARIEV